MAIELHNIRFHYPNLSQHSLLDIPHWSLSSHEQVFIQGPSGSGKSTLLNLLSGLLQPTHGEIHVLGNALHNMSNRQRDAYRAKHIGYVFQQFNLIPYLNAIENTLLAHHFNRKHSTTKNTATTDEAKELLAQLNIDQKHWHQPTRQLSMGQQQRVAIARAFINKPQLLIADEPTSSLDDTNKNTFMDVLMTLSQAQNMSLVFVSHDVSLQHYFNRVDTLSDINTAQG